jgi:hypothetical protein
MMPYIKGIEAAFPVGDTRRERDAFEAESCDGSAMIPFPVGRAFDSATHLCEKPARSAREPVFGDASDFSPETEWDRVARGGISLNTD